ncbi:MAG TPA: hypothetical protein PKL88_00380 [bacterium]|nr:hypothetical protein [bacterium]
MQTQNQKFIKWVPKRDTYVQKVLKKGKTEVFIPKEARKKFEIVEGDEKLIEEGK